MNKVGPYMGICFLALTKSFLANYADFCRSSGNYYLSIGYFSMRTSLVDKCCQITYFQYLLKFPFITKYPQNQFWHVCQCSKVQVTKTLSTTNFFNIFG